MLSTETLFSEIEFSIGTIRKATHQLISPLRFIPERDITHDSRYSTLLFWTAVDFQYNSRFQLSAFVALNFPRRGRILSPMVASFPL